MTYTSQNISQIDKDKQLADREKSNEKKFNSTASTPAKATDASVVTVKSEKEVMSHNISQIELDKQLAFQDNNDQKMTNAAVPDLGQETDVVYDQKLDSKLSRRDSLLNVREERLEERKKRRLAYQAKISNRNKRSDSSLIEEKQVEWSASISGLAVTLQNLGDNSAIGPDLNENDYDQDYSIGFGAAVHSKVSKNLQLSVGINYYKFNRTTKNISSTNVFLPINDPLNINLEYVNFNGNINQLIDNDGQSFDIEQELEYVSIPFTARYLIVDGMVSPYFTGGFSYVHLMDNSFVYIGNDGNTIRPLGDSNIINDFNVTFNFGAGLKFKLVDNIQFVTEGIFNYQFFQYKDRDVRRSVLQFSAGLEYKF
jgi:opacity protein-like surface antigen